MKSLLLLLAATAQGLVDSEVRGPFTSPQFIWDTTRCFNSDPILDSKTIKLIAKGQWPADKFCVATRRDLKVDDDLAYAMSVEFNSHSGLSQQPNIGHIGLKFNYRDDDNYDFLFKRVHINDVRYGSIRNGVLSGLYDIGNNPQIEAGKWYHFKIEVSTSKNVFITLNDVSLGSFQASFPTRGYGGVLVANGFDNTALFRNYDVAPILANLS